MFPTINFDGVDPAFREFVRNFGWIFEIIKHGLLDYLLVPLNVALHLMPPLVFRDVGCQVWFMLDLCTLLEPLAYGTN
jgi:hypothetical protein